jgi:hypothetical protein
MKKLALLLSVVFLTVATFGQSTTTLNKNQQKQTAKTEQSKITTKKQVVAVNNIKNANKTAADTSKTNLKKDGTPDKRFKDNKSTAKTTGPLKKDGTADMRYKSNKVNSTTKK